MKEQNPWKTLNDFSFLKFKGDRRPDAPILFPGDPSCISKIGDADCFVIGYPGKINLKKFEEDYNANGGEGNVEQLYYSVQQKANGFQHKIISTGRCTTIQIDGLLGHRCPTLRGTSGGVLALLVESSLEFIGVHVGGALRMENNYAIPISLPAFIFSYLENVATEDFVTENKIQLKPFLEYCEKLRYTVPALQKLKVPVPNQPPVSTTSTNMKSET